MIEQAKGILMARHGITADDAFERLRGHSQHNGHKLATVAAAIVESHLLLAAPLSQSPAHTHHRTARGSRLGGQPSGRRGSAQEAP
jgi:hypothetical protein